MDKRYQVFISSTYADLKDERSKVIQSIMELDCIPAGMEIFPAIDEEQFNFIKRVIDDCDYYLLIIGGRYGSLAEDGLSYTEKEFDYAIEKGIKVIAFIHSDPDSIPVGKTDKDQQLKEKLDAFKTKVSIGRMVKFWNNADQLPGLVALSLSKTIKTYPAVGWVRANMISNVEALQELNELRKVNEDLKKKLQEWDSSMEKELRIENLASLDDYIEITGSNNRHGTSYGPLSWTVKLTWGELFSLISPFLLDYPSDNKVKSLLGIIIYESQPENTGFAPVIDSQKFQTIKVQLDALDLIKTSYLGTTKGGKDLFWSLTKKGKALMYELRSVKKLPSN